MLLSSTTPPRGPSSTGLRLPSTLPDGTLEQYRDRGPKCDHCDYRRNRHDTFVVRNRVTEEVAQVGRTCLEAYTSCSPDLVLYAFDSLRDVTLQAQEHAKLDDAPRTEMGLPIHDLVTDALIARGRGRNWSGVSWSFAFNPEGLNPEQMEEWTKARNEAARVLAHAQEKLVNRLTYERANPTERMPETLHNVAVIVSEGFCSPREYPKIGDLIAWYMANKPMNTDEVLKAMSALNATPVRTLGTISGVTMSLDSLKALVQMVRDGGAQGLLDALNVTPVKAAPSDLGVGTRVRFTHEGMRVESRIFWYSADGKGSRNGRPTAGVKLGNGQALWLDPATLERVG